jgi:hypothetical protein
MLLAGPSNGGLANAGMGTAVSLAQATVVFITSWSGAGGARSPSCAPRYVREAIVIQRLAERVQLDFDDARQQLDRDDAEARAGLVSSGSDERPDGPSSAGMSLILNNALMEEFIAEIQFRFPAESLAGRQDVAVGS